VPLAVTVFRAFVNLELARVLGRREAFAVLEDEEQADESRRAHRPIIRRYMTLGVRYRRRSRGPSATREPFGRG
jgi:hypothetical protein